MDAYIARQPILNRRKQVYAYELLFRDGIHDYTPEVNGDMATSEVVANSIFNIGLDEICGNKKSFINFTSNLLLNKSPLLLPKETIVVEILEDVEPETELVKACQEIAKKGFLLALDDFVYSPALLPLIKLADIIKFDFRISTIEKIESDIKQLPEPRPRLLAEKIETHEEFEIALDLGFELFQGYFFCKPEIIKSREIESSQLVHFKIVATLNSDDLDFNKLENLVTCDVGISYKLLRYINSPFFATVSKISSIKQALVYLGVDELRRFMSLMAISNLAKGKPSELLSMACIRGKFCELLGAASGKRVKPTELFTVGMFSLLDAILDQPMNKIIDKIPLSPNLVTALVNKKGLLAGFLILIIAYEQGRWTTVKKLAEKLMIPETVIPPIYLEACRWSNQVATI
ncbi:MAG: HDOD domain-containing protein [Deltaproteobacteria bacterium]|nr:HDOD domain-containing protein [Candidatus Tharpella sp.]